mmetsp:Transcript_10520/g.18063  ORF Transcript_10520/g.18063 Transcript_10520/m.18063 type:complete len:899 (+) Transcript_10520:237-2933(+)|eukprot:CAMPEP_0184707538 /NCGR_PEP_ID=MMETSP0313-20130426/37318_1 /TAXON_ID=2792 /ORGANISM="Porphyridium aerugineum, Strain SAG 1380-2" /LENGTH=898 /DNA_ID=CAMNT_0027169113 /DNA_START=256 /DNA_END=2952 /DNA_ORIENTATION=+
MAGKTHVKTKHGSRDTPTNSATKKIPAARSLDATIKMMDGLFEGEEEHVSGKSKHASKRKRHHDKEQDEPSSGEDEHVTPKLKTKGSKDKKKRTKQPSKDLSSEGSSSDESEIMDPKAHRDQLDRLKEKDPEFYQYLLENDEDLLNFSGDDESDLDDEDDEDEEGEEEEEQDQSKRKDKKGTLWVVSNEDLQTLESTVTSCPLSTPNKSVKRLLAAFAAGVELSTKSQSAEKSRVDEDGDPMDGMLTSLASNIKFESSKVYRRLMSVSFFKLIIGFERVLGIDREPEPTEAADAAEENEERKQFDAVKSTKGKRRKALSKKNAAKEAAELLRSDPTQSPQWKSMEALMKHFGLILVKFLNTVRDATLSRRILKNLMHLVSVMKAIPKFGFRCIKVVCEVWASSSVSEATAMRAFLLLRRIAAAYPKEFVERVVKSMYRDYLNPDLGGAVLTTRLYSRVIFSAKCIVDIMGLSLSLSYPIAFTYIREIAMDLKSVLSAITGSAVTHGPPKSDAADKSGLHDPAASERSGAKSKKAKHPVADELLNKLISWSNINRIRLWCLVLSEYHEESQLRPLIYPFTQVVLGILQLTSGVKYVGARFHLLAFLAHLGFRSKIYIPLSMPCCSILGFPQLLKKNIEGDPKNKKKTYSDKKGGSSVDGVDWRFVLKASPAEQSQSAFCIAVVNHTLYCLAAHFRAHGRSPSFPESAYFAIRALRKFGKLAQNAEARDAVKSFVRTVEAQAAIITKARAQLKKGPNEIFGASHWFLGHEDISRVTNLTRLPIEAWYDHESQRILQAETIRDKSVVSDVQIKRRDERDDSEDDGVESPDTSDSEAEVEVPLHDRTGIEKKKKKHEDENDGEHGDDGNESDESDEVEELELSDSDQASDSDENEDEDESED